MGRTRGSEVEIPGALRLPGLRFYAEADVGQDQRNTVLTDVGRIVVGLVIPEAQ